MEFCYEGGKVAYFVRGAGSVVLLLHGWGCTHSIFDPFVDRLSKNHKVISVDFPGFGESDEPSSVWGVEDYSRCLEALCDSLGVVKPYIVGHSFGGRVAIMFASRRPVARLVLTDSAGVKPRRSFKYYVKVYSYKALKFLLLKVLRSESLFSRFRSGKGSEDYRNASPRMKEVLSRTVNEDLCPLMGGITAPVLLFWGTKDTATPISDARRMEKLFPDCGVVEVPGGSHFSFLEAPVLYANVLDSFLV